MLAPKLVVDRVSGRGACDAVAKILVSAFVDDPAWTSRFPGRKRRRGVLKIAISALTHDAAARGQLVAATRGDDVAGAPVAWAPDDHPRPWRATYLRAAVTIAARTGIGSVLLARRYRALRRIDVQLPPHWHLAIIAVRPGMQRERIGSRLLAHFLDRVGASGQPACLETTRVELVAWYRRFGFEVRERLELPGGRTAWIMWREPRA